jgi:uncharacterized protein
LALKRENLLESLNLSKAEILALTELKASMRQRWPLARIKLFGSKAAGTSDAESDLDVLLLLPCTVTEEIRTQIVHKVFEINLVHESNMSVLIVSEDEWDRSPLSLLPIHASIEQEGIAL